jgi:hypothetical protein
MPRSKMDLTRKPTSLDVEIEYQSKKRAQYDREEKLYAYQLAAYREHRKKLIRRGLLLAGTIALIGGVCVVVTLGAFQLATTLGNQAATQSVIDRNEQATNQVYASATGAILAINATFSALPEMAVIDTLTPTVTSMPTSTDTETKTFTPEPTKTYTIVPSSTSTTTPKPTNTYTAIPSSTNTPVPILLQGGIGRTNGAKMKPGEFQVEYYCHEQGYDIYNDRNNWYCMRNKRIVKTLTQQDFDRICQNTYNNPQAFALQTGTNRIAAYNWRCYENQP